MHMVERRKDRKGQVDVPNGNIIVWRAGRPGDRRHDITESFIDESIPIKYINRTDDKKKKKKVEKELMARIQPLYIHILSS
ncbi:MAG: hypothetical protein AAB649_05300 [Patescibacteria group bacterium]